jgi:hypothetical protein
MDVVATFEMGAMRLAALAVFAAATLGWGALVVRRPTRSDGVVEWAAWRGGAGLVVLATAGFGLAAARVLDPLAACVVLAAPWVAPRAWRETGAWLDRARGVRRGLLAVVFALVAAPVFGWAIYPPTEFDATLYHLPMARSFLDEGGFTFLETLRFPVFPAFNELLFALLRPLAGDAAANLVQLFEWLLGAGALYAIGARHISLWTGALAAALWVGSPLIVWEVRATMVDLGVALFAVLALGAWERARGEARSGALAWAGAFAGAAAATKYTGLFVAGLLGVAVLRARSRRAALGCAAAALLVAGPHYARTALATGSPVHPYFAAVTGDPSWQPTDAPMGLRAGNEWTPWQRLRSTLFFPYESLFERHRWNQQPPVSPALLLLAGAAVLRIRRPGLERRWLLAGLGLLAALVLLLPPAAHYLAPAAGLACIPAAAAGEAVARRLRVRGDGARWLAIALVAAIAAAGPAYAAWRAIGLGLLPTTAAARDRFLAGRVAGYEALVWLNRTRGRDHGVYALHLESSRHWSAGRFVGDWWGPWSYDRFALRSRSADELASFLREAGAEYLLVRREHRNRLPMPLAPHFRLVWRDPDVLLFERVAATPQSPGGS